MHRIELADTLLALLEGCVAAPGAGLVVTDVLLDVPMEVAGVVERDQLVFFAALPHTRWKSGVLPAVHRATLRVEVTAAGDDQAAERGGPA